MLLTEEKGQDSVYNTTVVRLHQTKADQAEGWLHAPAFGPNGGELRVRVVYEENKRIWPTVSLVDSVDDKNERAKIAHELSKLAIEDPETYSMFAVDARDGETVASATLTVDLTAAALDRWFKQLSDVLTDHGCELYQLVHPGSTDCAPTLADSDFDDDMFSNLF